LKLPDALELTILIARKDPLRHPRVAARWLLCYLKHPETTCLADRRVETAGSPT
jgi:hypothetical protein